MEDFHLIPLLLIVLHYDNKAAMHIAENSVFYERTKNLRADCITLVIRFRRFPSNILCSL